MHRGLFFLGFAVGLTVIPALADDAGVAPAAEPPSSETPPNDLPVESADDAGAPPTAEPLPSEAPPNDSTPESLGDAGVVPYDEPSPHVTPENDLPEESTDRRYPFRARALLQPQYRLRLQTDHDLPVESGAVMKRVHLGVAGEVLDQLLAYDVEVDLGQGKFEPLNLYIDWRVSPHLSFRAGQFKVPSSHNWMVDERALAFPDRSIATEEFRYDYDIGFAAIGSWLEGRIEAMAGVVNGAGKNVLANDNVDPALVARFLATPLGRPATPEEGDFDKRFVPSLTLGTSTMLDHVPVPTAYGYLSQVPLPVSPIVLRDADDNGVVDGVTVWQLTGDVVFKWAGAALEGEVYYRKEVWGRIGDEQLVPNSIFHPHDRFGGAFLQVSYTVWQSLLVGGRISFTEYSPLVIDGKQRETSTCTDSNGGHFACALPYADRAEEQSLLVLYAFHRYTARAGAMFSRLSWSTGSELPLPRRDEQRVVLQLQLAF